MAAGIERRTFCWRYGKRSKSLSDHLKESKEHNNNFVKKNQGGKNTRYKK